MQKVKVTSNKNNFVFKVINLSLNFAELTWQYWILLFCADICLKEVPSIAESVYNIQLLKQFSTEYLNECFHLKPEDLLYSPPVLKVILETLPSVLPGVR